MTDEQKSGLGTAASKANQIWADFIPVFGFILSYNVLRRMPSPDGLFTKDNAIFWATGVLIALTLAIIAWRVSRREKISTMMLISAGIVGGFGLIGILLREKGFIYVKPTVQQIFLAGLILIPMLFGRNFWKAMFKDVFDLPDFAWRTLAIRWAGFFIAMALWNEYLWRTFAPGFAEPLVLAGIPVAPAGSYSFLGLTFGAKDAEDVWANWKLAGPVFAILFGALNTPYMLKHLRETKPSAT